MDKVTIFGAGHVGATTAFYLALSTALEIALVDIDGGKAKGLAMDIEQSLSCTGSDSRLEGGDDPGLAERSDLVIITAGFPRLPGMSRLDLTARNAPVVESIARGVASNAPDAVLINVTNPVDEMTYLAWRASGFDERRIIGMAGVLDTSRFVYFLNRLASVPMRELNTLVLGSHGDDMAPLVDWSRVGDRPLGQVVGESELERIVERTRNGGAEIVSCMGTGSAYYAPAVAIGTMATAVLKDTGRVLPVSAYLRGEYGIDGIFLGVPARLGRSGVLEVVLLSLSEREVESLKAAAAGVSRRVSEMGKAVADESD
ncbi:MAG: malate dehydrogenase [Candidatus Anoxymicrobium japonicum]|uniref:Malate dehydrogenase n=1 Tax=Candidatus Anoxymicrobium japonicum TaxID=2013648 RepID=A0A2N3G4A9_9ACTN|nr:MAG: malate dehydrogenase [Candidatus Anoxymicrobium japonicum]